MKWISRLRYVWAAILVVAGLTWGIIAVFDKNIVLEIFNHDIADYVYGLFGIAAIGYTISFLDRT
jgi:uncharacterized membrane protein YuzA (DUF378 family)